MEEFKPKEAIPPEDALSKGKKENRGYKYAITTDNEQKAKKTREEIEELMKKNDEIKKNLDNLST